MGKIYNVTIWFEEYDSIWSTNIGTFSDRKKAEYVSDKWRKFFEYYSDKFKNIDKQNKWDEYYEISSKYGDIENFKDIEIEESSLDEELMINNFINDFSPETLVSITKQWDRDYKIESILTN